VDAIDRREDVEQVAEAHHVLHGDAGRVRVANQVRHLGLTFCPAESAGPSLLSS
jgi:DUF1365 family protein